jgi:hypothetical protein
MATTRTITIGDTLTCAETGKQFIAARDGCSTNYAWRSTDGAVLSDEGVIAIDHRTLKARAGRFFCYVSTDGKTVTGWKGNTLGRVIARSVIRNPFGGHLTAVSVIDVHGGRWHGRGAGNGMCITLRPSKTA